MLATARRYQNLPITPSRIFSNFAALKLTASTSSALYGLQFPGDRKKVAAILAGK
jgi:hypothetical protein